MNSRRGSRFRLLLSLGLRDDELISFERLPRQACAIDRPRQSDHLLLSAWDAACMQGLSAFQLLCGFEFLSSPCRWKGCQEWARISARTSCQMVRTDGHRMPTLKVGEWRHSIRRTDSVFFTTALIDAAVDFVESSSPVVTMNSVMM